MSPVINLCTENIPKVKIVAIYSASSSILKYDFPLIRSWDMWSILSDLI